MTDPVSEDASDAEATASGPDSPAPGSPKPDIAYEQARDELVEVVRKLEAGGTTLEESLALWERGEYLAGVCETWLEGARTRLRNALGEEDE